MPANRSAPSVAELAVTLENLLTKIKNTCDLRKRFLALELPESETYPYKTLGQKEIWSEAEISKGQACINLLREFGIAEMSAESIHGVIGLVALRYDHDQTFWAYEPRRESDMIYLKHYYRGLANAFNNGHKNIRTAAGFVVPRGDPMPIILFPRLKDTTLSDILQQEPRIPLSTRLSYLIDVLQGLEHIHSKSIVHGDVCSENIGVEADGAAYLRNFGGTKYTYETPDTSREDIEANDPRFLLPPEYEGIRPSGWQHDPPITETSGDMWLFGCTMIEVLDDAERSDGSLRKQGVNPNVTAAVLRVKFYMHPRKPRTMNEVDHAVWDFIIDSCLVLDPTKRITAAGAIQALKVFMFCEILRERKNDLIWRTITNHLLKPSLHLWINAWGLGSQFSQMMKEQMHLESDSHDDVDMPIEPGLVSGNAGFDLLLKHNFDTYAQLWKTKRGGTWSDDEKWKGERIANLLKELYVREFNANDVGGMYAVASFRSDPTKLFQTEQIAHNIDMIHLKQYCKCAVKVLNVKHPNIVPVVGFFLAPPDPMPVLLLEAPRGKTFEDLLAKKPDLLISKRLSYLRDVLTALKCLHYGIFGKPEAHGDIATDNIMVSEEKGYAQLSGFSQRKYFMSKPRGYNFGGSELPPEYEGIKTEEGWNMAPDVTEPPGDMWLFGCVMIGVLDNSKRTSLGTRGSLSRNIALAVARLVKKGTRPDKPATVTVDDSVWDFILDSLLELDPLMRITAEKAIPRMDEFVLRYEILEHIEEKLGGPVPSLVLTDPLSPLPCTGNERESHSSDAVASTAVAAVKRAGKSWENWPKLRGLFRPVGHRTFNPFSRRK